MVSSRKTFNIGGRRFGGSHINRLSVRKSSDATSRNRFSVLANIPVKAEASDSDSTTEMTETPSPPQMRKAELKIPPKHRMCWSKGLSLIHKTLAGLPHTSCPKELKVPKHHSRAFNIFFDKYNWKNSSETLEYEGALKAWSSMAGPQKNEYIIQAKERALKEGIFYCSELISKEKSVNFLTKACEKTGTDQLQKKLEMVQKEFDEMIAATKLILIGTLNGVQHALRLAPGCSLALHHQAAYMKNKKRKICEYLASHGEKLISIDKYLRMKGFISSSSDDSWTESTDSTD